MSSAGTGAFDRSKLKRRLFGAAEAYSLLAGPDLGGGDAEEGRLQYRAA
jgi:hypothetical protein